MTPARGGDDAFRQHDPIVDELAELLLVMRRQTSSTQRALDQVEHSRFNLLAVHAITALVVTVLFLPTAPSLVGPTWQYLNQVPGFPYTFAAVMCAGGLILLPGSFARNRWMEFVGLTLIYLWYAAVAVGFLIPVLVWCFHAMGERYWHGSAPGAKPSFYSWAIYAHLAIIMRVHMWTLYQLKKRVRAAEELARKAAAASESGSVRDSGVG